MSTQIPPVHIHPAKCSFPQCWLDLVNVYHVVLNTEAGVLLYNGVGMEFQQETQLLLASAIADKLRDALCNTAYNDVADP